MSNVSVLAIDGPSGAGKGAVSAALARRLGWNVLDSGAVYRAVALASLERGIDADNEAALVELAQDLPLSFEPDDDGIEAVLAGRRIGSLLRSEEVSVRASRVAAIPTLRNALLGLQRAARCPPGLVADGRDMGTVVFPDAALKIFLDASVEERANRRYKQLKTKGESVRLSRLFRDMQERDRRDRERAVAPTVPAADAVIVDSTHLSLEQVIERIAALARQRFGPSSVAGSDKQEK
ncbi:MAG: cytidylate kinase [Gammaproteobacteria bacterium HGW-Gammaproteobacteria-8]|nr:MAG: cytidylate kinase [Gammaproteobacteria bacterium HGW-Gammaproteobacteria-8]